MIVEHGFKVVGLWTMHVTQRLGTPAGHGLFAGESWREYGLNVLGQALPWTPLAVLGAGRSLGRALSGHAGVCDAQDPRLLLDPLGGDRLLCPGPSRRWCWCRYQPRNAHYAIHAMIPWSVWSALGLASLGGRLTVRGWSAARLRRLAVGGFTGLAAACGLGFWLAGPWLDRRGMEWAFYETTGRLLASGEPLALLYDDWDREAYPTPFGAIPHDLAVRLYYLKRPACWHFDTASLRSHGVGPCLHRRPQGDRTSLVILGRERDLPALEAMGRVEVVSRSQGVRWDRTYLLARVWLGPEPPRTALASGPSRPGHAGDRRGRLESAARTGRKGPKKRGRLGSRPSVPVRSLGMEPLTYDLVVIGSGPAGESGAAAAASFGKRVALIEKSAVVGGASANTGTLPSKTLRETALAISGLRARDLYGVDLSLRREATVADFMFHEKHVCGQRAAAGPAGAGPARDHALSRRRLVRRSSHPAGRPGSPRGRDRHPPADGPAR